MNLELNNYHGNTERKIITRFAPSPTGFCTWEALEPLFIIIFSPDKTKVNSSCALKTPTKSVPRKNSKTTFWVPSNYLV